MMVIKVPVLLKKIELSSNHQVYTAETVVTTRDQEMGVPSAESLVAIMGIRGAPRCYEATLLAWEDMTSYPKSIHLFYSHLRC